MLNRGITSPLFRYPFDTARLSSGNATGTPSTSLTPAASSSSTQNSFISELGIAQNLVGIFIIQFHLTFNDWFLESCIIIGPKTWSSNNIFSERNDWTNFFEGCANWIVQRTVTSKEIALMRNSNFQCSSSNNKWLRFEF